MSAVSSPCRSPSSVLTICGSNGEGPLRYFLSRSPSPRQCCRALRPASSPSATRAPRPGRRREPTRQRGKGFRRPKDEYRVVQFPSCEVARTTYDVRKSPAEASDVGLGGVHPDEIAEAVAEVDSPVEDSRGGAAEIGGVQVGDDAHAHRSASGFPEDGMERKRLKLGCVNSP